MNQPTPTPTPPAPTVDGPQKMLDFIGEMLAGIPKAIFDAMLPLWWLWLTMIITATVIVIYKKQQRATAVKSSPTNNH